MLATLRSYVASNSSLAAAGISVTTSSAGDHLVFTNSKGEQFKVTVDGDTQNKLGLGSFQTNAATGTSSYASIGGTSSDTAFSIAAFDPNNTSLSANLQFSLAGGASNSTNAVSVNRLNAYGSLSGGSITTATLAGAGTNAKQISFVINGTQYDSTALNTNDSLATVVGKINAGLAWLARLLSSRWMEPPARLL